MLLSEWLRIFDMEKVTDLVVEPLAVIARSDTRITRSCLQLICALQRKKSRLDAFHLESINSANDVSPMLFTILISRATMQACLIYRTILYD
jgi:hypothetical protein